MNFFADSIEFITRLSTDTLIIIFSIVAITVAGLYTGKQWSISFVLSLFIASLLAQVFPFDIGQGTNGLYGFGIVVGLAFLLTTVIKRFVGSDFPYKRSKKYIQATLLGLAGTITLLSTGLLSVYQFSPFITRWFEGDMLFWSMLVPFVILYFFIKR